MTFYPASKEQNDYIELLRKKHRVTPKAFADWCVRVVNAEPGRLSSSNASRLIDLLKTWDAPPAEVLRAMGQIDLPGL